MDEFFQKYNVKAQGQRNTIENLVNEIEARKNTSGPMEIDNYIFDKNKILRDLIFPQGQMDGIDYFCFLIPRNKDIYDNDGNFVKKAQVECPAMITSDHQLLSIGVELEQRYRVRMSLLPTVYPLRWSLASIYRFIQEKRGPNDGLKIFKIIRGEYVKYLYFASDAWYDVRALWDMGTYFFTSFYFYPIAELRGMKGTAKNKIFAISRGFSFNATEEMTNPSEATLFHETAERRPTKYIDEAERLFIIQNGKVMADPRADLLNASYKYTGSVPRMEKVGNKYVMISYSVYSPTMVGSINGLYGATEDRALIQTTTKAPQGDKRANLEPNPNDPVFSETRDKLYQFALESAPKMREIYGSLEIEGIEARELFLWKPLLTLAKLLDADLFDRVLTFAKNEAKIKSLDSVVEDSQEWRLLTIAMQILMTDARILVKDIVERWKVRHGEAYAPHNKTVVRLMDGFGFRSYRQRFEDGTGYTIPKSMFAQVVQTTSPNLYSTNHNIFDSFLSASSAERDKSKQTELNETEGNEGKEEKEKKEVQCEPEANERNEANERGIASEQEQNGGGNP